MTFIDIDGETALQQIGRMNLMAISGGRAYIQAILEPDSLADALVLKVGCGYAVHVMLDANDTYTVRRVFSRKVNGRPTMKVKGEQTNVYCDEVGEVAYQASCFRSNDFGAHKVGG